MIGRRRFLKGCCAGIAALGGARLQGLAFADDTTAKDAQPILVTLFLRGGIDALSLVAPVADDNYHVARARLALKDTQVLDLDGYFGLHSAAAGLHRLYGEQELAVVMGCGLSEVNRSHFKAQEILEAAGARGMGERSGWMGRYVQQHPGSSVFKGISIGPALASSMAGYSGALALNQVKEFALAGDWNQVDDFRRALRRMWAPNQMYGNTAQHTLDAADLLETQLSEEYQPAHDAVYPESELAGNLRALAQIVRLEQGLCAATIDFGGWDTHENQAAWDNPQNGYFAELTRQLSESLCAFWTDLGDFHDRLTVVVMSEFGRRLKENDNLGTDHGYGGVMLVMARGIAEQQVFGAWPGLATEDLEERADLRVTTDYRNVLAEVLQKRMGIGDTTTIFPGSPSTQLGFLVA